MSNQLGILIEGERVSVSGISVYGKQSLNVEASANNVTVTDCYFETTTSYLNVKAGAKNVYIRDNQFKTRGIYFYTISGNNYVVEQNVFYSGASIGFQTAANKDVVVLRGNNGYDELGDLRNNAGNIEMYNSTAWVIIGP